VDSAFGLKPWAESGPRQTFNSASVESMMEGQTSCSKHLQRTLYDRRPRTPNACPDMRSVQANDVIRNFNELCPRERSNTRFPSLALGTWSHASTPFPPPAMGWIARGFLEANQLDIGIARKIQYVHYANREIQITNLASGSRIATPCTPPCLQCHGKGHQPNIQ